MEDLLTVLQLGCSVQLDKRQAVRLGTYISDLQKQLSDKHLEVEHCHAVCGELRDKLDAISFQVADSFGDGYYDGFIDGAKHHEDTDCSTDPNHIGKDAMRCSEIAEAEKSKRLGIPSRQELAARIDALHEALHEAINFRAGA